MHFMGDTIPLTALQPCNSIWIPEFMQEAGLAYQHLHIEVTMPLNGPSRGKRKKGQSPAFAGKSMPSNQICQVKLKVS